MGMKYASLPARSTLFSKFRVVSNANIENLKSSPNSTAPKYLQGWLHRKPQKFNKTLTFAKIRDAQGKVVQVIDKNSPSLFKSLKPDSTVSIEVQQNGDDWECKSLEVLGASNLIPGELQAEKTKEWPAQYRYIQLRQPHFQKILRTRAKIVKECRSVLDEHGFTEIETPILFKSTPEGAREFLVPTRRRNKLYALPQSPQQYKQLLIASGIDKYYQVAKCFRDEDLRADRQPEFTQLDLEMGFVRTDDVQQVVSDVVKRAWALVNRELSTVDTTTLQRLKNPEKFSKLTYAESIARYGIDKPDLRSPLRILQLAGATAQGHAEFPVLECLKMPSTVNIDSLDAPSPRVRYVTYETESQLREVIAQIAMFDDAQWDKIIDSINDQFEIKPGDVLAFGDRQYLSYENPTPLGRIRQKIVAEEHERKQNDPQAENNEHLESVAVWVERFPSFEPVETEINDNGYPIYDSTQLKATHHPFTMIDLDDYHHLENNRPLECHGMHFDLVIDGVEIGGGSQRIHDSELQRYVLERVLGVQNPDKIFGHLLEALATGCPPHAGLAIGLDRMVAMLLGLKSIRDVIAFPKTVNGSDPVVGSPSSATPKQLADYHLKCI